MIIDTDDKTIISEVKALFKSRKKTSAKSGDLNAFYEGFRDSVGEVKASIDGNTELKDAKTWLNELQD